jgi:hypothetical protein
MRRRLNDAVISIIALSVLLLMLMSVDPRLREQVQTTINTPPTSTIRSVTHDVRDMSKVVVRAAEDHSLANGPMVIFGIAATVLVVFMLRT